MKLIYKLILLLQITVLLIACTNREKQKNYIIGFSQCMTDDVWRKAMEVEMNIEASSYDNLTILLRDANENNQLQVEQIKELINKKVDVLVISPNESYYITPIAVEAYRAGIPTIIVDRKINSDEYTSYIGGNSYEIGKRAGEYASSLLPSESIILEMWGTKSTSPAQERHEGFIDGLEKNKNFQIISKEGKWRKEIAERVAQEIEDYSNIDLIYAHNDVMALGIRDVILERDSSLISKVKILGVDGAFGKDAGLEAVADERITASFLYPTGGDQVIKVAMKIVNGEPVEKSYILNTALIDKATATTLLMQSNQLINYQQKIEQQRKNIQKLLDRFSLLRYSLTTILFLMTVLVFFAIYIYIINQKIKKRNDQLRLKNSETEKQKEQLIALNEQIKDVTEQKVRFFMNVSHEVKTPLTLILNPLEKLLKSKPDLQFRSDLLIIKRNAERLSREISHLLDFQKVESNKIQLNLSYKDIVSFSISIKSLFEELAESKNIEFIFTTNEPKVNTWIDCEKIEKVITNLLSNAFKFTPAGGKISLEIESNSSKIFISVKDNGIGISADKLPFVFDRFFTDVTKNSTGTGIGLHLSKEFTKLHGGELTVQSIPFKETVFIVEIPLIEKLIDDSQNDGSYGNQIETEFPSFDVDIANGILSKKYDYTILIVEDDDDIRKYLIEELSQNFRVLYAKNGIEALAIIDKKKNITLVLTDVLMPEMNGFELCRSIKLSRELSDIPVFLLTALSEVDQRIYGIAEGADEYISKPFQIDYVKIKIIRFVEERKLLQIKFMNFMQTGGVQQKEGELLLDSNKQFLSRFIALLESSYSDSEVNIERISDQLGVSRVHLYRKIKEMSGFSPVDYLRNFRLAKSIDLLKLHRYSISEIAYQIGFSSPAYFTKCFRDTFNMTPTEFMKKN